MRRGRDLKGEKHDDFYVFWSCGGGGRAGAVPSVEAGPASRPRTWTTLQGHCARHVSVTSHVLQIGQAVHSVFNKFVWNLSMSVN